MAAVDPLKWYWYRRSLALTILAADTVVYLNESLEAPEDYPKLINWVISQENHVRPQLNSDLIVAAAKATYQNLASAHKIAASVVVEAPPDTIIGQLRADLATLSNEIKANQGFKYVADLCGALAGVLAAHNG
jgi:hypothetical protein